MSDREVFPSRGPNGFDSVLQQGLVALETGKKWQRHRRVITQFLTDKHLKQFTGTIQEEMEIFLDKWSQAATDGTQVNAQYDLSCLAEDVSESIVPRVHNRNSYAPTLHLHPHCTSPLTAPPPHRTFTLIASPPSLHPFSHRTSTLL
jgi:hypothetical protein